MQLITVHNCIDLVPQMPTLPKNEDDRTTLPTSVLEGFSEELIENTIEDVYGKVQIMDQTILRDMPEGQIKSTIIFEWFSEYSCFLKLECAKASCGTVGIRFQNGTLLSPDFAVWTRDRFDGFNVCAHMMQVARSPKLVCELEWLEEIYQPRKGVDKIVNYYLNQEYFGLPDDRGVPTVVEEAWLVVTRRAGSLSVPDEVHMFSPSKSFFAELPIPVLNWVLDFVIQLALWSAVAAQKVFMPMTQFSWVKVVLWVLREFTRMWSWGLFPLLSARYGPPLDPRQPYIAIYRRGHPPVYYHFELNHLFLPPRFSVLCYAPPVSTNLHMSHFYKAR